MATFAVDGPVQCSGLPVMRYSPASLAAELGAEFQLIDAVSHDHHTPLGTVQSFVYTRFRHASPKHQSCPGKCGSPVDIFTPHRVDRSEAVEATP
jgi:hypothetical protein